MSHRQLLNLKNRIEATRSLEFQRDIYNIIIKHHPGTPFKSTPTHILTFFNRFSDECYKELYKCTNKRRKPNPNQIDFDDQKIEKSSLLQSFRHDNDAYLRTLKHGEAQLLFQRHLRSLTTDDWNENGIVWTQVRSKFSTGIKYSNFNIP